MDLLTNAKESIQVGVEDYHQGSRPRLLSAVRNIHAGILLLFKQALRDFSPPDSKNALMMEKIAPHKTGDINKVIFVGAGKKTASLDQIKERFNALGVPVDWDRFNRINETRNDIEHRFPQLDQKGLRGLIADSFIVMRAFIRDVLFLNPSDILGIDTRQSMLKVTEVYETERSECDQLICRTKWKSVVLKLGVQKMACPTCASGLFEPNEDHEGNLWLECRSCRANYEPGVWEFWAVMTALASEELDAPKEGRASSYAYCPSCGSRAFVIEENQCAVCRYIRSHHCSECGKDLPPVGQHPSSVCAECSRAL
jgi:hypothetical protein